jgi:hypothetical protein
LSSIHFLDHEGGNDKNQPEELDGRDDEDRPAQKTEKTQESA